MLTPHGVTYSQNELLAELEDSWEMILKVTEWLSDNRLSKQHVETNLKELITHRDTRVMAKRARLDTAAEHADR